MPITRGAKKAHRASLTKRVFNLRRKGNVSSQVKILKKLITAGDKEGAETQMKSVQKALDKAAKHNTLDKNHVSRRKSRLSKLVKKIG